MNSLRQHFGIGSATKIDSLVVRWPSGTVDELSNLSINGQITLVEGSASVQLGDCNCDGDVDFLDIGPFIAILSAGDYLAKADMDLSGAVDFLDIGPFVAVLSVP